MEAVIIHRTLLISALFIFAGAYAFAGNHKQVEAAPLENTASAPATAIAAAAYKRTKASVRYDPQYVRLSYPGGDVPSSTGVCTDVVIRTYRAALGFDFQRAVHEDMNESFSSYPKIWGLKRTDKNIDHRRVPNLERYLIRQGAALEISKQATDYKAGDIVSWRLGGNLPHIGIVSDKRSANGAPLIIHNIGRGPAEEDILFSYKINGHFRYFPEANTLP